MTGGLLTAAAMGVATGLGYSSMAPRSQLFGRTFTGLNQGSRQIALTYDDGPSDPYTPRLLEVLERHQVKATFFMIGRNVARLPHLARAVAQAGHVIGNHTYSHPNLIFATPAQMRRQLQDCDDVLHQTAGEHSRLFRPPYGGRRPDSLRLARQMQFVPVMWSVTGWDWNPLSATKIEKKVARQIRGGDVILLHDGGHRDAAADRSATITATDHLIRRYRDLGYRFVTIPEMMASAASAELQPDGKEI